MLRPKYNLITKKSNVIDLRKHKERESLIPDRNTHGQLNKHIKELENEIDRLEE